LIGDPEEFVRRYMDTTTTYTGQPEAFVVLGSPGTFDGGLFGDGTFDGASKAASTSARRRTSRATSSG
jgi:hypothetical protein